MRILVNHIGYERDGPKRAVIEGAEQESRASCRLVDGETGREVFAGPLGAAARVGAWKEWRFAGFDFSEHRGCGVFSLRIDGDGGRAESETFEIAEGLLRRKTLSDILAYFKSQRASGKWDRKDRNVPFYGGRKGTVDLHGGWYDASGDLSKYLSHLSYANAMNPQQTPMVVWDFLEGCGSLRLSDAPLSKALEDRIVEEALHGADFLARMQDPEGYFYSTVFDGWSHDPERRMVCSYSTQAGILSEDWRAGFRQGGGMAVAALARASGCGQSGEYPPDCLLAKAERGFLFLQEHGLELLPDRRENIIDDYCALLAACELFGATGKDAYRREAVSWAERLTERLSRDERYSGWWRSDDRGEIPYSHAAEAGLPVIALLRFLETVPGSPVEKKAIETVKSSLAFELSITREVHNPFGYARQYVKPLHGQKRSSFFMPHDNPTGYWWQGENARLASLAAAARMAFRHPAIRSESFAADLQRYAACQLDWILGLNPYDVCMLDGHGRNNPEYEWGWFNAPGGIVNGITAGFRDERDIDFLPEEAAHEGKHRWRWSEQWLPHAAWFFLAACL